VNTIKNNLRLFDKEYQKELDEKMKSLGQRLKEINEGKEEFYTSIISKPKIDELHKSFGHSKQVEDLIFKTVAKIESLKSNHEESAYIFLKIREMLEQQEKVGMTIEDNLSVLSTLQENIRENADTMKKNIHSLKERLSKIKK
jgi:methyl-accepting chemotaxis protein